jgi:hypothetical protein
MLSGDKHSSLFVQSISEEEEEKVFLSKDT